MQKITPLAYGGLTLVAVLLVVALTFFVTPAAGAMPERQAIETETPTATPTLEIPTATATETVPVVIPTSTATASPTVVFVPPTATGTATATLSAVNRPLLLASYSLPKKGVLVDKDFTLGLDLSNQGQLDAYNVIVTLQGENLLPRGNGGVQAVNRIPAGKGSSFEQGIYVSTALAGQSTATLTVSIAYSDENGTAYTTSLVLLINLIGPTPTTAYGGGPALATRTPTPAPRSKLIINSYKTDLEKLQAGNLFKLDLNIQNQGNSPARNVTMVLGGANVSAEGTPSGGVSGGGANLTDFAPMGSSNLYSLGDIPPEKVAQQTIPLVVNVTTEPGVYTLKISFVYEDSQGTRLVDDQVITLLVYSLPKLSVSFYQDVPDFFVGESRPLPFQITNINKSSVLLGDLTIFSSSGILGKNKATIGTVESGGYFTLDADYTADTPGPVTLTVQINYTDDFQQPGMIEQTLSINVIDIPIPLPEEGPGVVDPGTEIPTQESLWSRLWQALLGFLGFSGS